MRIVVYALLALLYVLHNDVWYWDDPALALGLPIGVTYHVVWTLAVSLCFWLAVQYAWPEGLEAEPETAPSAPSRMPDRGPADGRRDEGRAP